MCRNIKNLYNFDPPVTEREINDAALQFVRKVSGSRKPSKANQAPFELAVEEISAAVQKLLDSLVTSSPPRNRETEAAKAKERRLKQMAGTNTPVTASSQMEP